MTDDRLPAPASPFPPPASRLRPDERTGAQVMCEALVRENVEVMFGIPGGAIMPFYHAMWEYRDCLRHVLCRHEQGAGHAAEGYARSTGKPGVCVATSGPGATNLVTPIANAWMDSTPLVAITGQVSSAVLGKDAFQETDITGITLPITKHNYRVTRADDLPSVFHEAFHIARSGRPGPVLIDVTKDAQQAKLVPDWNVSLNAPGFAREAGGGKREAVRQAARLLANASKPLILAGQGVIISGATNELRAFAERTGTPVITTLQGIGAFPEDHPLSIGMPGMHGWVHVNRAIQECDVLLSIGARFDDRVTGKASTFAPHARVIHIDIDPSEIGKNVKVAVAIIGDARLALLALLEETPPRDAALWLGNIRDAQATHQHRQPYLRRPETTELMPHDVYAALNAALNERGGYRVVTDVGQHQMWAAQLIEWRRPRTHITSGGAGTMGFAVPAGMGAGNGQPDATLSAVRGGRGLQMGHQEVATIRQEGISNVKIAIVNKGYLGMVRQWQQLFEGKRYSGAPLTGPSFAGLAEAYGLRGFTIDRIEEAQDSIRAAWDHDGSAVLDFRVEREANVFPLVPPGSSIGEMVTREAGHPGDTL